MLHSGAYHPRSYAMLGKGLPPARIFVDESFYADGDEWSGIVVIGPVEVIIRYYFWICVGLWTISITSIGILLVV